MISHFKPDNTYVSKNSVIWTALCIVDKKHELLPEGPDQTDALKQFQHDLASNLTNDRNLYKVLGFNRRRASVDEMKIRLMSRVSDKDITALEYKYLARLLKLNIVIINQSATGEVSGHLQIERTDHPYPDSSQYVVFDQRLMPFGVSACVDAAFISRYVHKIIHDPIKHSTTLSQSLKTLKVADLTHIAVLLGVPTYGLKKTELLSSLGTAVQEIESEMA
jgi:hypothetical protein